MKYDLERLSKVELRDVWPHEALDFTKWLSEEPNLALLSSSVGIELELIETESSVGSFNVDMYAQESGTGRKVIIENQLENTNHDHLGKVITYAAGKGAEVVIWVVARARDEHRQAIEWLNRHTDSDFDFFLVEIELWSIGDSLPAPRFNVVERPNEWSKAIKLSEGLSETERVKLSYWTKYREVAQSTPEFIKEFNPQKPSKDHWSTLRCGTSAYHIALLIDTQRARIGIEFYVPDDKEIGRKAIENAELFEKRLGLAAIPFDAKKASGLRFYKEGCKIKNNEAFWTEFIAEQLEWAVIMKQVIAELGLGELIAPRAQASVSSARLPSKRGNAADSGAERREGAWMPGSLHGKEAVDEIEDDWVLARLSDKGICHIDQRGEAGCLWALGGLEIFDEMKEFERLGARFTPVCEGSIVTHYRPAWLLEGHPAKRERLSVPYEDVKSGTRVEHRLYGPGRVTRVSRNVNGDVATVKFEHADRDHLRQMFSVPEAFLDGTLSVEEG